MTNTLVWSGGFDSTALLLSKMFCPSYGEQNILWNVISFRSDYIPCSKSDADARLNIRQLLSQTDQYKRFNFIEIELSWNDVSDCKGQQCNAWFKNVLKNIKLEKDNNFFFGYVRYDDFYHEKHETLKIFKEKSSDDCNIVAHFPFEWERKHDILKYYSVMPDVFHKLSWDGDDKEVKLRFKCELREMLDTIIHSINLNREYNVGERKDLTTLMDTDLIEIMSSGQRVFEFYDMSNKKCDDIVLTKSVD